MSRKIFGALVLVAASPAWAQTPPPAAPAKPPAQAQVLPPEKSIALDLALEAVQTALNTCKANNSLAIVQLVDLNDNVKVLLAADGARSGSYEYARRKAYTVLKKGLSSGDFGKQVGPQPLSVIIEGDPNLTAFGGGLPIKRGDMIVGAISVSGPTGGAADEICAQAGLDKIKGRL